MQLSHLNKPTWFFLGIFLGVIFTLAYTSLVANAPAPSPSGADGAASDRYCPSCPVCPDGSRPGLLYSMGAAPSQKQPLATPASSPWGNSSTAPRILSPLVETGDGGHLGLVQPLYALQRGRLRLPPGIKRLAIDVGTSLLSPSSAGWFKKFPADLLVLAFEPNPFSHSLVAFTSHPSMALNPKRFVFFSTECKMYQGQRIGPTLVQWYTNCMNVTFGHLIKHRSHFWPANAAVSDVDGFASFNLGVGDPGVGSLYEFKAGTEWTRRDRQHEAWGHAFVPKVRLDSVLRYVPEDVTLELLKIDAQGHDAEVVAGVGRFLPRFKCVIGEFDTTAYAGAQEKAFDYRTLLRDAGFQMASEGVWVNPRFLADFKAHNYLCMASDVKPLHSAVLRAASTA